jgi:hypothetical protein
VVINVVTILLLDHAFFGGQAVSGQWSLYQQMSIVFSGQMSVNVYTSTGNFRFFSNPKEKAGIGY